MSTVILTQPSPSVYIHQRPQITIANGFNQLHQHSKNLYLYKSQCGDCVLAPGDSDRSSFIVASSEVEEIEVGSTELLLSKDEEADEGRDTTMYFCIGRELVSPGPLPDSSFTKGCKVEVALGTVLVTGEADWEELRVIT
ncbi:hypothetical protein FQN60_000902 [Etheostoma spectabile]|uniref:Uncharacterized protein n=1 Tax=Etheostoma spectabile TaxID=54343 RepID=A0A5J5D2Y9_9PERO|nr:hypothetical protein FQN60_000902 [Etheostoma spectabile]